jgi:hypothetical protein
MRHQKLDQDTLKYLLEYFPDSGVFVWCHGGGPRYRGKIAGSVSKRGYEVIRVLGKIYYAHRLAWLYVYGEWPDGIIDHIDRDPLNNRIQNLRVATAAENTMNSKLRSTNKSGVRGVYYEKQTRKWRAAIKISGQSIKLGRYEELEDAAEARRTAEKKYGIITP